MTDIPDILHEIGGCIRQGDADGRYKVVWRATQQRLPDAHIVLVPPMLVKGYEPTALDAAVVASLNAHNFTFEVIDEMTGEEVPPEQLPRVIIPARDPSAWWALRALAFQLQETGEVLAAKEVRDFMAGIPPLNGYGVK